MSVATPSSPHKQRPQDHAAAVLSAEHYYLTLAGSDLPQWVRFMEDVLGAQLQLALDAASATAYIDLFGLYIRLKQSTEHLAECQFAPRGITVEFLCSDGSRDDFYQRLSFVRYRHPGIEELFVIQDNGVVLDFNGIAWAPRFLTR